MKIERVHLNGFGRLVGGVEFEFVPGLNVFFGPNESGKSTLQEAILVLLYGPLTDGRWTKEEASLRERYQPWQPGAHYGGHIVYRLQNGRSYRLQRDLAQKEPSVYELDTGRDVTTDFPVHGQSYRAVADTHLGVSRRAFANSCFIRQSAFDVAENAVPEVAQRLIDTGGKDRTAAQAAEQLRKLSAERIGGPRAQKPLTKARDEVRRLEQLRDEVARLMDSLHQDLDEQGRLKCDLERHKSELVRSMYLQAARIGAELAGRITRIRELDAEAAEAKRRVAELAEYRTFPIDLRDAAIAGRDRWQKADDRAGDLEAQVDLDEPLRSEAGAAAAEIRKKIMPLDSAAYFPADRAQEIARLEADWSGAVLELNARRDAQRERDQEASSLREEIRPHERLGAAGDRILPLIRTWRDCSNAATRAGEDEKAAREACASTGLTEVQFDALEARVGMLTPDELTSLEGQPEPHSVPAQSMPPLLPLALSCVLAIAAVGLGAGAGQILLGIAAAVMLLGVGAAAWAARRRQAPMPQDPPIHRPLVEALLVHQATSMGELRSMANRYWQAQPLFAGYRRAAGAAAVHQEELARAHADLAQELRAIGGQDVDEAVLSRFETQLALYKEIRHKLQFAEQQATMAAGKALDAQEQANAAAASLSAALKQAGFEAAGVDHAAAAFHDAEARYHQYLKLRTELATIQQRIAPLDSRAEQLDEAREAAARARRQLVDLLAGAGITDEDPAAATEKFLEACSRRLEAEDRQRRLQELSALRTRELDGSSPSELTERIDRISTELVRLERQYPHLAGAESNLGQDELAKLERAVQQSINETGVRLSAVEQRIGSALAEISPLPEIEEELEARRTEVKWLEEQRDALEMAATTILEAADQIHRDFLPRLNELLGQGMGQITAGRYTTVNVDHDRLEPVPHAPERSGAPVPASMLSRGTEEQAYLVMRAAVAQMMSQNGEPLPLIMDDPLVNFDPERQRGALEYLSRLAGDGAQVILFTQLPRVVEWLEEHLGGGADHRIHKLAGPVSVR